jgi:hypothetical protein
MRFFIASLLALFGLAFGASADQEASTSLATNDVKPFLEHLNSRLHLGLDVVTLSRFARETGLKDERTMPITAQFKGTSYSVSFHVFTDDINDSEIYFVTSSKALSDAILTEMGAFAEAHGM